MTTNMLNTPLKIKVVSMTSSRYVIWRTTYSTPILFIEASLTIPPILIAHRKMWLRGTLQLSARVSHRIHASRRKRSHLSPPLQTLESGKLFEFRRFIGRFWLEIILYLVLTWFAMIRYKDFQLSSLTNASFRCTHFPLSD